MHGNASEELQTPPSKQLYGSVQQRIVAAQSQIESNHQTSKICVTCQPSFRKRVVNDVFVPIAQEILGFF